MKLLVWPHRRRSADGVLQKEAHIMVGVGEALGRGGVGMASGVRIAGERCWRVGEASKAGTVSLVSRTAIETARAGRSRLCGTELDRGG